jgi:hypothetical protein
VKQLEEYAEHARECRASAAKAHTPEVRDHLLEMAERWEELARQRAVHLHLEDVLAELLRGNNHKGSGSAGAA